MEEREETSSLFGMREVIAQSVRRKERGRIHDRSEGFPSARTFARGLPLGKF